MLFFDDQNYFFYMWFFRHCNCFVWFQLYFDFINVIHHYFGRHHYFVPLQPSNHLTVAPCQRRQHWRYEKNLYESELDNQLINLFIYLCFCFTCIQNVFELHMYMNFLMFSLINHSLTCDLCSVRKYFPHARLSIVHTFINRSHRWKSEKVKKQLKDETYERIVTTNNVSKKWRRGW